MKAHLNLFFHIFKYSILPKNLKTVSTFCSSASICTVAAYICNILISLFHYILSHPLIVKSETNTTSKSLKKFKELFPDKVKLRIRFSLDNLKLDDDMLNIPLFMADYTDRLIGLALQQQNKNL